MLFRLLFLLVVALAITSSNAIHTIRYNAIGDGATVPLSVTPWTTTFSFPQYNPINNTLLGVAISFACQVVSQTNATDQLASPVQGHLYTIGTVSLTAATFSFSETAEADSASFYLQDYGSQWDTSPISKTAFKTVSKSSSAAMAPFIGTGTVDASATGSTQLYEQIVQIAGVDETSLAASYVTDPLLSFYSAQVVYYY